MINNVGTNLLLGEIVIPETEVRHSNRKAKLLGSLDHTS